MSMESELKELLTNSEDAIKQSMYDMVKASYMMGANKSLSSIQSIFATLGANLDNEKISDKDFRDLTGQFLERLNKLVDNEK